MKMMIPASSAKPDFETILIAHLRRYPMMQVADIYKLVHQASLGSEHANRDQIAAQRWLEQELAQLGEGPEEPLNDPISPGGHILRIHLRPFLAEGGNPGSLLEAFLRTANEFQGSLAELQACWAEVSWLAAKGCLPFGIAEVQDFGQSMAAQGYPAVHHSAAYTAAYRPAYRVVAVEFWSKSSRVLQHGKYTGDQKRGE